MTGAPLALSKQRMIAVLSVLKDTGARSIADLGCGTGRFLELLAQDNQFEEIIGVDLADRQLRRADRRLTKGRVKLLRSSLNYYNPCLLHLDAVTLLEVIEHLDPSDLPKLENAIFGFAHPGMIIVTTPNVCFNVKFEKLARGGFRHPGHRFEWTPEQFKEWAARVSSEFGYVVNYSGIGPNDSAVGCPTQMAVFRAMTVRA